MTHHQVLYGALAAACVAVVTFDTTIGRPSDYPVLREWFGHDWEVARNIQLALATSGAAVFGYLAANAGKKDGS